MTSSGGFTVENVGSGGHHRLVLAGELDIASTPILEAAIAGLCENGAGAIVLDLSRVTFMDSTGLRAVLAADRRCQGQGHSFALTGANGAVRRLFELTGVSGALQFSAAEPGTEQS
jgi:anti-sigma B factor antagonist